ncbi:alpha/beta hydrolase [Streptomyces fructofermentans]|uniref:alpha/beta fold hydrolase n=1 Tax=Streptomyces fructofermentans TaxID=152141 RepID=UPI0033FE86DB
MKLRSSIVSACAAAGLAVTLLAPQAAARQDGQGYGQPSSAGAKPTIVLLHGAWADASGWTEVVKRLQHDGYTVKAPAVPLRSVSGDSKYIASILKQTPGPLVVVGHSYGGAVMTNAAYGNPRVKALVYIAAFAPDAGESLADLVSRPQPNPIPPLPVQPLAYPKPDGSEGIDLYLDPAQYPSVFLNNRLPRPLANAMAVEQRPLSNDAFVEKTTKVAWKKIPSWYLVAKNDRAIDPDLQRFMASRARARTVQVNAPHLAMVTNPKPVTALIERAVHTTAR